MVCCSLKCMLHLVSKLLFSPPPHHIILTKGLQVISSRYCYSSGPAHSLQILLTHPHPSIQPSQMTMGEKLWYTLWEEIRDQEPLHLCAAHTQEFIKQIFVLLSKRTLSFVGCKEPDFPQTAKLLLKQETEKWTITAHHSSSFNTVSTWMKYCSWVYS